MDEIVLTRAEFDSLTQIAQSMQEVMDEMRASNSALKDALRTIISELGLSDVIPHALRASGSAN